MNIIKLTHNKSLQNSYYNVTLEYNGQFETYVIYRNTDEKIYSEIQELLKRKSIQSDGFGEDLFSILSVKGGIASAINSNKVLSDYFRLEGNTLYFKDHVLETTLANYITKVFKNRTSNTDREWKSIIRFVDNLYQNIDKHVRKELFKWIQSALTYDDKLTITEDGCFIGYKGCCLIDNIPCSIHKGTAFVDGVEHKGHIPNEVGTVITMPRVEVTNDSSITCAYGLHVGTYKYADEFQKGVLLTCKVNPRDVVSVPYDCGGQKIRCCEYKVLSVQENLMTEDVYYENEEELEDDFFDDEFEEEFDEEY